jgi:hypothetical protein
MAKIASKGVVVKTGVAATPTVTLPGVKSVSFDFGSREMIPVTSHDSTVTKEYIPAPLRDTVSAEIELFWDPAAVTHDEILDAYLAGTKWYFTFIMPDAGAATVVTAGYLTNVSVPSLDPETGALMATASFKADSAETFTQ